MNMISNTKEMEQALMDKNIRTVQLIYGDDPDNISMVIGNRHFSTMHIMRKELALEAGLYMRNREAAFFIYKDKDLPEAWKKSYAEAGIPEDEWDRRTDFHPFNDMGEHFCIDDHFLNQINPHEDEKRFPLPVWKRGIVRWFRSRAMRK